MAEGASVEPVASEDEPRPGASKARYLIPLAVFGALVVVFAVGLRLDPSLIPSPLIEKPAPAFSLPDLYEADRRITVADLSRRPSLFNVFASWCAACRVEHPLLMRLSRSGAVPIYGLNYKDEHADALAWLGDLGNPYAGVAVDRDGRVGIDWGVYGVPETFVVDTKGVIRYKHIGPLDEKAIEETVLPLIRKLEAEADAGGAGSPGSG